MLFDPIPAHTGAMHTQPGVECLRPGFAWAHTPDYTDSVCLLGAIDAPETIPSGGIRSQDWTDKDDKSHRLLIAYVIRGREAGAA